MKKLELIVFLLLAVFSLFGQKTKMDAFVNDLMGKMTLDEKLGQLNLSSGNIGAVLGGSEGMEDLIRKGQIGATGGFSLEAVRKVQNAAQQSRLKRPSLTRQPSFLYSMTINRN